MRQNQQDNEHRNIIREQILRKGYAHQYDIRRFIPCGREKANQILAQEMLEAEREGKSTITGISANRLPKYVGLTKEEIHTALDERFDDAFQIFFRNLLPLCHIFQTHRFAGIVECQIQHQTKRIPSSCRNFHFISSEYMS